MIRFNADIGTFDRPLKERPEVFHPVSVDIPVNVLLGVVDYLVCILAVQAIVRGQLVSHHLGTLANVLANDLAEFALPPRGDVMNADLSGIPFKQAEHDLFTARAASMYLLFALVLVHEACRATDESLIGFDGAGHLVDRPGVLRIPDAVHHEPCRLLGNFEGLPDLVRANAVLAVRKHPHCAEPLVETYRRILEYGADLYRVLFLAVSALPNEARRKVGRVLAFASRTYSFTLGPFNSSNLVNTRLVVAVVPYGAHQTTVFADVIVFHDSTIHPESR